MPELPEVETTKASLTPLIGKTVRQVQIRYPKLRYEIPSDLPSLVGFRLTAIHRRAKYLLLDFYHAKDNRQKTLLIHLGMSGSLQQHIDEPPKKHDHVLIDFGDDGDNGSLNNGDSLDSITLHYHDPRRFGMMLWVVNDDYIGTLDTAERFLEKLGPEPLGNKFDLNYLRRIIHRTGEKHKKPIAKPIKALIMEQAIVVGVGNIYAAESLFLSKIHPLTPACRLDDDQLSLLIDNIKQILHRAIEQGGSSLKDFTVGEGKTGYFQQTLLVYGRDGQSCTMCGTILENVKIAGRASVYCPHCQPLTP
ncbi:bifunctional DNA-formamidopyrimidine glycosylase/DNA-(apurinic or apyrimidinic site) lyase [Moraxella sp. ZJ142]|uniref:bifunctional DNA-formamidopyrimidine glycosylase/DNA-(apurinic or apyrimidinic site) lyase n=1 Tax=Moraxella marmotae TaxID=3344520 RepID=UPI0035D4B901